MTVLIDELREDHAIARSSADAPEIDGVVFIEHPQNLQVGQFIEVDIIDATEHDLIAQAVLH